MKTLIYLPLILTATVLVGCEGTTVVETRPSSHSRYAHSRSSYSGYDDRSGYRSGSYAYGVTGSRDYGTRSRQDPYRSNARYDYHDRGDDRGYVDGRVNSSLHNDRTRARYRSSTTVQPVAESATRTKKTRVIISD